MTMIRGCHGLGALLTAAALALFLTAGAPSARAESGVSIPGYVAVPLRRAGNILVLETKMNGHDVALQVDTGAPLTVLSETAYHNCVPAGAEANLPANIPRKFIANGHPAMSGWVQDLRAGAMNFGSGPVAVTSLISVRREQYEGAHEHHNVEGLLGADVLSRYRAIVDPSRQTIYFNTDSAQQGRLDPFLERAGWTGIPMTLSSGRHYCVPTDIEGERFEMIVDTGAYLTVVDAGRLAGLKLDARSAHMRGNVVNMPGAEIKALALKDWKIGDYKVASIHVGMTTLPSLFLNERASGGPVLGLLGAEVLLGHHAIIDLGGMKLYLHP